MQLTSREERGEGKKEEGAVFFQFHIFISIYEAFNQKVRAARALRGTDGLSGGLSPSRCK